MTCLGSERGWTVVDLSDLKIDQNYLKKKLDDIRLD